MAMIKVITQSFFTFFIDFLLSIFIFVISHRKKRLSIYLPEAAFCLPNWPGDKACKARRCSGTARMMASTGHSSAQKPQEMHLFGSFNPARGCLSPTSTFISRHRVGHPSTHTRHDMQFFKSMIGRGHIQSLSVLRHGIFSALSTEPFGQIRPQAPHSIHKFSSTT
jgi:hypothetical protein